MERGGNAKSTEARMRCSRSDWERRGATRKIAEESKECRGGWPIEIHCNPEIFVSHLYRIHHFPGAALGNEIALGTRAA